jgi:hypothetical protein
LIRSGKPELASTRAEWENPEMHRFSTFVGLTLLSLGACVSVSFTGCAAERVTLEDEDDTGVSRTPKDAASIDAKSPTDASTDGAAPSDGGSNDGSVDAAPDASDAGKTDAGTAPLVISEVFAADILSKRYVEIAGPPGTPLVDLKLRIVSSTGTVLKTVDVPKGTGDVMPARGTWVVGGIAEAAVDNGLLVSAWDLPSDNGSVQLVRQGATTTLLDVVGYGTCAAQVATAPTASFEGVAAVTPGTKALLRKPGRADTGVNADDFCKGSASPNAANVCDP